MKESTNIRFIKDFCAVWSEFDAEQILRYVADDIVYVDMPFPDKPQRGKAYFKERLHYFFSHFTAVRLEIKAIAESDSGVVFTERTDHLAIKDAVVDVPVSSVATIRNGKVSEWHEYYDLEALERQMTAALGTPWRIDLRDVQQENF